MAHTRRWEILFRKDHLFSGISGRLFTCFDGAVLGVFQWIDGKNIETDATKAFEYQMLANIYRIPADGLNIRREQFLGERRLGHGISRLGQMSF